jgi:hypothetical protein
MLREFPGYTLSSLLAEDVLLLRMMKIEALGRRRAESPGGGGDGHW